jgi:hypothetical protein
VNVTHLVIRYARGLGYGMTLGSGEVLGVRECRFEHGDSRL